MSWTISDTVICTLLTVIGAGFGYWLSDRRERKKIEADKDTDSTKMLLEAEQQLQKTIEKMNRLWAWNRQMQDHIYKQKPPPPPMPPDDLFD